MYECHSAAQLRGLYSARPCRNESHSPSLALVIRRLTASDSVLPLLGVLAFKRTGVCLEFSSAANSSNSAAPKGPLSDITERDSMTSELLALYLMSVTCLGWKPIKESRQVFDRYQMAMAPMHEYVDTIPTLSHVRVGPGGAVTALSGSPSDRCRNVIPVL